MDLAYTSAAELAGLIRSRAVSPVEVMRATLERIERSQPVLNAFITIGADAAMAAAREAEAAVMRGDIARAAAWRAGGGEGPDPDRRSSHHLGFADLQGPRPRARRRRGGATEAGGRHRGRQDHDAGIRPAMPDAGAAVRAHAQRLARGSQFGRFERRVGGRGCRGARADRGRHRWRRIDAHSRGLQRRRRIQAGARRGAAGIRAGRVRQHLLHHADDAHGAGHRADARCDGGDRPARSAHHGPTEGRFRGRRAAGRSEGTAHRLAHAAGEFRGRGRGVVSLRGRAGSVRRAWRGGVGTDGSVRESRGGVVRQQRRLPHGAVRSSSEAAPRDHVSDLRAADGPGGELLRGGTL